MIFKKLCYRYFSKKIHQKIYRLYEIKIIKQNNEIQIIEDEYYTRKNQSLLLYDYIDSDKQLFKLNSVQYIPMSNIQEIQINIKDEQILNYIDFDKLLFYMTLEEINKENAKMESILKYKKQIISKSE